MLLARVTRIVVVVSLIAGVSTLSLVASADTTGAPVLRRFESKGISFRYPSSWFVTTKPLSNAVDPVYRFSVSTARVRRTFRDLGPCLAGVAHQLPPNAVLAYLREAVADREASIPGMPERPRTFRLPTRSDNSLCGFSHGRWVPFKTAGRAFYLGLYVGPRVALRTIIDRMRISPRVAPGPGRRQR